MKEADAGRESRTNPLAKHYSRFRVAERLLLTGHSHQAWPDAGFEGQIEAWSDAAELVDDKWERAFAKADRVRQGYAGLLGAATDEIALGTSTFELVTRFLSALPLAERPRFVSTDGEFHTLRRLLDRLAETGALEIVKIAAEPVETLAERLAAAIDDRTTAALLSSVLYVSSRIVPDLRVVAEACGRAGAELLLDAYHQVNVVPLSLERDGLAEAFVVGGGYKYCQLGEGNCFLRVPPGREAMRPVLTGWYSEHATLSAVKIWVSVAGKLAPNWMNGSAVMWAPKATSPALLIDGFWAQSNVTVRPPGSVTVSPGRTTVETWPCLSSRKSP